jgi:hypothetical protein
MTVGFRFFVLRLFSQVEFCLASLARAYTGKAYIGSRRVGFLQESMPAERTLFAWDSAETILSSMKSFIFLFLLTAVCPVGNLTGDWLIATPGDGIVPDLVPAVQRRGGVEIPLFTQVDVGPYRIYPS